MVKHVNLLIALALFFFADVEVKADYNPPPYSKIVEEIIKSVSKDIEKELKIIPIGDGGRMHEKFEAISLKFMAYKKPNLQEARELEMKASEKLLYAINSNESLRPYLAEYPFSPDRAKVSISFQKKDNTHHSDGSVTFVFQVKNTVYYERLDPITDRLETIVEESYEEALKIVKNTNK